MSTNRLNRLSAVSLIIGGILLFVHFVTHPMGEGAQYVSTPLWIPSHVIGFIAWPFLLLGITGLYLRESSRIGVPGLIAVVLLFFSGAAFAGAELFGTVVFQTLYPHAADPGGPLLTSPAVRIIFDITQSWILWFIMLSIVTLRAKIFPQVAGWLIIAAGLIGIGAAFILPIGAKLQYYLGDFGIALFAAALCIWAFSMLSRERKAQTPIGTIS